MSTAYQINLYFGIHYDYELEDSIMAVIKKHPRFAPLASHKAEITVKKHTLIANRNADDSDSATKGVIFVSEMSLECDEYADVIDCSLNIEPREMIKLEKLHSSGVNLVTDLYDIIIKDFKKEKLDVSEIYLGWSIVNCTWINSGSTDSSTCDSCSISM